MRRTALAGGLVLAVALGFAGQAQAAKLTKVGDYASPVFVTSDPGDPNRLFVVEREGRIQLTTPAGTRPFVDLDPVVRSSGQEQGLLSMAFAPDYATSGLFYVYYTGNDAGAIHVAELRANGDTAAPQPRDVITIPHSDFPNHNGGQLAFGPDGLLYIGVGDGGGSGDPFESGQSLDELLGKLLRIDPRQSGSLPYTVPLDNPFVGLDGRDEIWSYGLRNPYRFSFDRRRGHLIVGDVGQDNVEEIDFVPNRRGPGRVPVGGYNFGWSVFEGLDRYREGSAPGHVPPAIAHSQEGGYCSIIGGYVVRDRSLGRGLYGKYVYGDFCRPNLRLSTLRARNAPSRSLTAQVPSLVSFGEDGRGRVYAISLDGPVYCLAAR